MTTRFRSQRGQSLVELMVVIGLCAVLFPPLITGLVASRNGKAQQIERAQAVSLVKEAEEAVRSIKENNWDNLSPLATDLRIERDGAGWKLVASVETLGNFTRNIVIDSVYRDTSGTIIQTGTPELIDPSTKKVTITVAWTKPIPASIDSTLYFTRYIGNSHKTETLLADFNAGVKTNSNVANTAGGEVTLAPNLQNKAKWCSPSYAKDASGNDVSISLPDGPPVAVAASADQSTTAIANDVFVAVAPNTTTSTKLVYITVSANTDIPTASLMGTFTLDSSKYSFGTYPGNIGGITNSFKTNDVKYFKSSSGSVYALLGTTLPDREVVVVQIKDSSSSDTYQDSVNKIYRYKTFFNTKIYGISTPSTPPSSSPTPTATPTSTPMPTATPMSTPTPNPPQTVLLYPSGDGNYTSWSGDHSDVDETGTPVCSNSDSVSSSSNNHRASFIVDLSSIPNGSTITSIDVTAGDRGDSESGGTYKLFVRLNGDDTDDSATQTATGTSGSACTLHTRTFNIPDTAKVAGTTLEIGVLKTGTSSPFNHGVRVGAMNALVTYTIATTPMSTPTRTPTPTPTPTPMPTPTPIQGATTNDQSPFGYGANTIAILGDTGYVASGGYLYAFYLGNIDSKSPTDGLEMLGCRIQIEGYDCNLSGGSVVKYTSGQVETSWGDNGLSTGNCVYGGYPEPFADNDIYPIQVGSNKYIYVAVGAGTMPEFSIVNVTTIPSSSTSPAINNNSCGRTSGGNSGWKQIGTLDFNPSQGTQAANSVFANSTGTRAYISSNGGATSNQLYILNTENKSSPSFFSNFNGQGTTAANKQLYPRRSMTVLNGMRAVLVGKDSTNDANDAFEYQVVNLDNEATPLYCGGLDFDTGFNDMASVSEADGDNFVYMIGNSSDKTLKIVQGGPDDIGLYMPNGTFTSQPLDMGKAVVFNRFFVNADKPAGSTLEYQIAAADPGANGCNDANYVFVGPGALESTRFTDSGFIPWSNDGVGYENPARCFKYKIYLSSTNTSATPTVFDFSVNYSP